MRQSRSRSQMLLEEEPAQRRQTAPKRSPLLSTGRKESWLKRRSSWGISTLKSSKVGRATVYARDQRGSTLGSVHRSLEKAEAGQTWDFDRQGLSLTLERSEHGADCALKCGLPSMLQT